ncbi:VP3 [Lishui pangolin virus]|nr:VP3 [Lishui pangolin virus]
MARLLFRRDEREFEASFQIKDEVMHLLNKKPLTFADAGGVISIVLEARIDGLGRIESYGVVQISFNEPLFSRVVRFGDLNPVYFEGLERCQRQFGKEIRGPATVVDWQRIAACACGERYLDRLANLYRRLLDSLDCGAGWLAQSCRFPEEVVIIPGLYEAGRGLGGGVLHHSCWVGVLGGTIDLDKNRLTEYRELFRRWLKAVYVDRRYHGPSDRAGARVVRLKRDYRNFTVGEGYADEDRLNLTLAELDYDIKWWPESSIDEMFASFQRDSEPSGCHATMNVPVPHYYSFPDVESLEMRCWKGIRETFINIHKGYSEGGYSGVRLNECLIVNCVVHPLIQTGMLCCVIGRGMNLQRAVKLGEVSDAVLIHLTVVREGRGTWWKFDDSSERDEPKVKKLEVAGLGEYEHPDVGRIVKIEYTGGGIVAEDYNASNTVLLRVPTSGWRHWEEHDRHELRVKFSELRGGPCAVHYEAEFSVLFLSMCGRVKEREHGWDGEETLNGELEKQVRFLERYVYAGDKAMMGNRIVSNRGNCIGKFGYRGVDLTSRVLCTDDRVLKDEMCEEGAVVCLWINALKVRFPDGVPPERWFGERNAEPSQAISIGHLFLTLAREAIKLGGKTGGFAGLVTLLVVSIAAFTDIYGWREAGWRFEDLAILWYGAGGAEVERLARKCGLRGFVASRCDVGRLEGIKAGQMWANKKTNIVIVNAYPDVTGDGEFYQQLEEMRRLGGGAEIYLQCFGYLTVEARQLLWENADGRLIDVLRLGACHFVYDNYVLYANDPVSKLARRRVHVALEDFVGWFDGVVSRRNTITSNWDLRKKSPVEIIRSVLDGEFGLPGAFEIDVDERDLGSALSFMGCINRTVRVVSFGRGGLKVFRLISLLDLDRIKRNFKIAGGVLKAMALDVKECERQCRQLPVGRLFRDEDTFRDVPLPHFLQGVTYFVIGEWVRRLLLIKAGEFTLFDIGGRNGDLSGWVVNGGRIRYYCIDPEGDEPLSYGERVMNGRARMVWNLTATVDENVKAFLTAVGTPDLELTRVIIVFSNSLTAMLESRPGNREQFIKILKEVDESHVYAFIRDQYHPCPEPGDVRIRGMANFVDPSLCCGMHFAKSVGTYQVRYPNTPRLTLQNLPNFQRLSHWYPAYFENLFASTARGFMLGNFGRWFWPIASRHILYLATKP